MPGETVDGPRGAAHPSGSHAIWFNEIGADLKSLDNVSAAPSGVHPTFAGSTADMPSFFDPRLHHGARDATESRGLVHCLLLTPRTQDPPSNAAQSCPSILRTQAASCNSSDTAFFEARSLGEAVSPTDRRTFPPMSPAEVRAKLEFWTSSAAHTHWRKNSEWILAWQQRRRSTRRRLSAADQEEKGSSNWATTPTCSALYAPVTGALALTLRPTSREYGKDLMTLLREYWIRQQHPVHRCGRPRTLQKGRGDGVPQ